MTEQDKNIKQLNLIHLIFDSLINKDNEEFNKRISMLAELRGERPEKVIFDIVCSLNSNINCLIEKVQSITAETGD